jgi:DNA-binding SARP family transcriptional activator/tetratricopeptide (TPR) repeat protein
MLELCLLGEQRVIVDGENVTAAVPQRTLGLLAAFAVRPGEDQLRAGLAAKFWPESTDEQALTNLRRELHALRQRLPEFAEAVLTSGRTVRWEPAEDIACDVTRFVISSSEAFADGCDESTFANCAERAIESYSGELLPAWSDEWLLDERTRLHRRCIELIDRLVALPHVAVSATRRIALAIRRVELEPLEESGYRVVMTLQADAGDRAAALTTFHRCSSMLERELGVPPDDATLRLYESLLPSPQISVSGKTVRPLTSSGRIPLVGRENELATLHNKWEQTLLGDGGLHLVVGEPGIGKTRLVSEFASAMERKGEIVARARCYSSRSRLSMAPLAEWLSCESLRVRRSSLDPAWMTEVARLVPSGDNEPLEHRPMVDAWQRHRFFEGLAAAVLMSGRPTLLTLDDIQWCDGETLAWLQFFLRRASDRSVLVVASGREEEFDANPDLGSLVGSLRIDNLLTKSELTPLPRHLSGELARRAGADLSDDDAVFEATGGFPLFVIESARASSRDDEPITAALEDSPRVQAVLDGRLDQLSDEGMSVARLASVVGHEFTPELLERASELPADSVVDGLDELWRRRIIVNHRRGSYDFSHDLLRDASLKRVPPPRLASMHRRVAEALEQEADVGTRAGLIADHYEQAGLDDRAVPFHERAAALANDRFAHETAIHHYRAACRLLSSSPPGAERDRHELRLRHAVSAPLNARYGFASTDLEGELLRSLVLAQSLGDTRLVALSLVGLFSTYVVQARMSEAYEVSRRALESSTDDADVLGQAHFAVGGSAMMLGRLGEGLEHFGVVPELTMDSPPAIVGTRPEVHSVAWEGHTLWLVDRDDEAKEHLAWAVKRAEDVDHPFSLAVALAYSTMHAQFEEDIEAVRALAARTTEFCAKHGFTYYGDWSKILAGWAAGGPRGVDAIDAGLAGLDSQGAMIRRAYYLSLRADLQLSLGDPDGARQTLVDAHELARKHSDLWWLPEVLRRLARLEEGDRARQLLTEAEALARSQGSVKLARRAASDLEAFGRS